MKKFGLIGKTLGHSFSQQFFNQKFADENIDAIYSNYEIPEATELMQVIRDPELSGLNVTIPYKQDVMQMMDILSEEARAIGAVNVVKIIRDAEQQVLRLEGYNTDVVGFRESIRPLLHARHTHALILGTGGASLAVRHGLCQLGLETLSVSRTSHSDMITYADLTPDIMERYKVIVNCTPLGTYPNVNVCADIPYQLLTPQHLLYDLVYNPELTLFLRKGEEQGSIIKNGYEMLLRQAKAAWQIWSE